VEDAELNCVSAMSVGALFPGRLNDVRNAVLKGRKPSVSSPIELVVTNGLYQPAFDFEQSVYSCHRSRLNMSHILYWCFIIC